jgi:hypothetical protein
MNFHTPPHSGTVFRRLTSRAQRSRTLLDLLIYLFYNTISAKKRVYVRPSSYPHSWVIGAGIPLDV